MWKRRATRPEVLLLLATLVSLSAYVLQPAHKEALKLLTAVLVVHLIDRVILLPDVRRIQRKSLAELARRVTALADASHECGLGQLFLDRKRSAPHVLRALERARTRILVLAVGCSQCIRLQEVVTAAKHAKRSNADLDFRVLMLDPFRKPAVFRALLETTANAARRVVCFTAARRRRELSLPQRPFNDVRTAVDYALSEEPPVTDAIRFYRDLQPGWMILIDDAVYFEPYTLGVVEAGAPLGPQMPVFRFDRMGGSSPFNILLDHFNTVWRTADLDVFHINARLQRKEHIIRQTVGHSTWLENVSRTLDLRRNTAAMHERTAPRKPCVSNPPSMVAITWAARSRGCKVVDYARNSLGLLADSGDVPARGTRVRLEPLNGPRRGLGEQLMCYFAGREYVVARVDGRRMGLKMVA